MMMDMEFSKRITPFISDLLNHCISLTGSKWEAEDLVQETLLRVHKSFKQNPDRPIYKAYLFRIATNLWIDQYRKNRYMTYVDHDNHDYGYTDSQLSIREAFEQLADQLTVNQMVLILLVDIFNFTTKETAELIRTTEGAVKEGVKRARNRLQQLSSTKNESRRLDLKPSQKASTELVEAFLLGFRTSNPKLICESYLNMISSGIEVLHATHKESSLYFLFRDPDGHLLSITSKII